MLTEEQRESVRYASEWLGRSDDIGNQKHAARLRTLLAGAQPKGAGMQAQMIASRICSALEADKDDGYDLEAGLFGKALSALIRELAAMSLSDGAQEPVAYTSADRLKRITERNRHVDTMWPASMRDEGDIPLYAHPQPMPQEPDCWAILTPNGSRLVPSEEAKVRRDAYPLYTQPQPMTQAQPVYDKSVVRRLATQWGMIPETGAARERPSVVLAYSTKGHNKPCGQTMGANGCGEFVTVYYGDIDAAERSARDRICNLEKAGHRFNWAIVMRADEEAYRGPAMTFEEIERLDRAKGE